MPLLVGLDFYQALQALQAAGIYIPQVVIAFSPSQIMVGWISDTGFPAGFVGAQSPAANISVPPGTPVLLAVQRFPFASVIDMPPDWRQNISVVPVTPGFLLTLSDDQLTTLDGTDLETLAP